MDDKILENIIIKILEKFKDDKFIKDVINKIKKENKIEIKKNKLKILIIDIINLKQLKISNDLLIFDLIISEEDIEQINKLKNKSINDISSNLNLKDEILEKLNKDVTNIMLKYDEMCKYIIKLFY